MHGQGQTPGHTEFRGAGCHRQGHQTERGRGGGGEAASGSTGRQTGAGKGANRVHLHRGLSSESVSLVWSDLSILTLH